MPEDALSPGVARYSEPVSTKERGIEMGLLQVEIAIILIAAFLAGAACVSLFSQAKNGKGGDHAS